MLWLILLSIALVLATVGWRLKAIDEVYFLALYSSVGVSAVWGFIVAPVSAQLTLGALALGWVQMKYRY